MSVRDEYLKRVLHELHSERWTERQMTRIIYSTIGPEEYDMVLGLVRYELFVRLQEGKHEVIRV